MKARAFVAGILLAFIATSIVYLVIKEISSRNPATEPAGEQQDRQTTGIAASGGTTGANKVIAYYFHGTRRCQTCLTIEAYANEAIRTAFTEELASGELEWHAVNIDEPENKHFVQDYQLATRSVVLVKIEDGVQKRWNNLERVWQLVRDKPAFVEYIIDNTNGYLAGAGK